MNPSFRALTFLVLLFATQCVLPPVPDPRHAPPPVLMPVNLSATEQAYVRDVGDVLSRYGFDPVDRGSADHLLEFDIDEGPVNVVTSIRLLESGRIIAHGQGRASGPPLIRRHQIVEDSFYQALREFEDRLRHAGSAYPAYP